MKNTQLDNLLEGASKKLINANISYYKIAKIIDEPESTVQNIFKGHCKYSEEKVLSVLERINKYLDYDPVEDMVKNAPEDPDLFIRLYALGLDSKSFTPDEKYKLAVAYKKLTDLKNKP